MNNREQNQVYHFLGVDDDGLGHYWLESDLLHSVIVRVNEQYDFVDGSNFISENGVARKVVRYELEGMSGLAEKHLQRQHD